MLIKSFVYSLVVSLFLSLSVQADAVESCFHAYFDDKEYSQAYRVCMPLAEAGYDVPQAILGFMYTDGKGVTQDFKEAAKWYSLAAEQGNKAAQFDLGIMYARGQGVPQDDVIAYMWWNLVAASGLEKAINNKDKLTKRMTPSQIAEAQKLSRECLKKEYKNCY